MFAQTSFPGAGSLKTTLSAPTLAMALHLHVDIGASFR